MANHRPQSHQLELLAAMGVAAAASLVPLIQIVLVPLAYLNTHIHEMCHAICAVITGGSVDRILVHADGSGLTLTNGGINPMISSAGYMGATLMGASMIRFGSNPQRARAVLGALTVLIGLSMILWVRGDLIGVLSGFGWLLALALAVTFLKGEAALFACQFIGLEQCLNSFTSVFQLLRISVIGEAQSDAANMQAMTLIPAAVWAGIWCFFSIALIGFTVRSVWISKPALQKSPLG